MKRRIGRCTILCSCADFSDCGLANLTSKRFNFVWVEFSLVLPPLPSHTKVRLKHDVVLFAGFQSRHVEPGRWGGQRLAQKPVFWRRQLFNFPRLGTQAKPVEGNGGFARHLVSSSLLTTQTRQTTKTVAECRSSEG